VPVRPEIEALADGDARLRARLAAVERFGLERSRKTLLVFGGSQGAQALNTALWRSIPSLQQRKELQVLHVTGPKNFGSSEHEAALGSLEGAPLVYRPYGYMERMDLAYAAADLAVCRSGAGTIAELMAARVPAVLVPFPHATGGHQEKNARALERTGAVTVTSQVDGVADRAIEVAISTLDDAGMLRSMAEAAATTARPDGAKGIVALIEEVMNT